MPNGLKVADPGKSHWTTVRSDKAANRVGTPDALSPVSENAALRTRLAAAEAELRQLHEQVLQSSELIKMLAEQHQGLVARAELNRRRTVALAVATFVSVGLTIAAMLMISY